MTPDELRQEATNAEVAARNRDDAGYLSIGHTLTAAAEICERLDQVVYLLSEIDRNTRQTMDSVGGLYQRLPDNRRGV